MCVLPGGTLYIMDHSLQIVECLFSNRMLTLDEYSIDCFLLIFG